MERSEAMERLERLEPLRNESSIRCGASDPFIIKSIEINLPGHHRLFRRAQRRLLLGFGGQIFFEQLERTVAVNLIDGIVHPPELGILLGQP